MKRLSSDVKALVFAEFLMAALCVYRFVNYEITGFFVSDEFGYYYNAVHGAIYSDRWFFGWLNIYLFDIFHIRSPDAFAYFLPFVLFAWGGGTILVFHRLLRLLGFKEVTVALSVLGSFVLVAFILLSLGFLTEGAGLCMAMCGTYCLVRFLKSKSARDGLLSLALSALFLGFAGGTREPYVAFEIGAIVVVVVAELRLFLSRRSEDRHTAMKAAALSTLVFLIPTGVMLYANTATTSTVTPIAVSIVQSIFSNPANSATSTTVSVTTTTTTTIVTAITTTLPNSQVVTQNATKTITSTTVVVTTQAAPVPFYGKSLLLNTAAIFVGGIVLGWGPIAFPIALMGFIMLTRGSLRGDAIRLSLLILAVSALGSYVVVSYIFANIPTYMTFQNYSTIIRFSGTALPAFFISAPFFLDIVAKNRKRILALVSVIAAVLLITVPVYEVYAISNLGYTTVSPFSLNYRSPAVQVRNYVTANPDGGPYDIIGVPYGWYFTPGLDLPSVTVYSPSASGTLSPVLNYSSFLKQHWTEFYVYSSTTFTYELSTGPYLLQFIPGASAPPGYQNPPFTIVNSTIVINNPDFLLTRVELSWP